MLLKKKLSSTVAIGWPVIRRHLLGKSVIRFPKMQKVPKTVLKRGIIKIGETLYGAGYTYKQLLVGSVSPIVARRALIAMFFFYLIH